MQTITAKEVNAGLTQASDAAFINAFTADGTPIKISKADLASVVAGQLNAGTLLSSDLNNITKSGTYALSASIRYGNGPKDIIAGCLEVISFGLNTSQILIDIYLDNYKVYLRTTQTSGSIWRPWIEIQQSSI